MPILNEVKLNKTAYINLLKLKNKRNDKTFNDTLNYLLMAAPPSTNPTLENLISEISNFIIENDPMLEIVPYRPNLNQLITDAIVEMINNKLPYLTESETIMLKRSDIMKEIERCKTINDKNPEDQYNRGRYNALASIIWSADIKR